MPGDRFQSRLRSLINLWIDRPHPSVIEGAASIATVGSLGSQPLVQFRHPKDVAVGHNGHVIFVLDNNRAECT